MDHDITDPVAESREPKGETHSQVFAKFFGQLDVFRADCQLHALTSQKKPLFPLDTSKFYSASKHREDCIF